MLHYQELPPPPRLADTVDCFWISKQDAPFAASHRVLPDGCADIVYSRENGVATLRFVGAMTAYQDFVQQPGQCSVGIRFRPAMWATAFRINGRGLANAIYPLEDLWSCKAKALASTLEAVEEPGRVLRVLSLALPAAPPRSPLQKAIAEMEQSGGRLSVDNAAKAAGLSTRHFQRRCLEETSLTPKLLARILRFREATAKASSTMMGSFAYLAAECGYADQSHLIREIRQFSGRTPGQFTRKAKS